jgi:hypothetical protein
MLDQVATHLRNESLPIRFGKIDATAESDLAARRGIDKFPVFQ